MKTFAFFLGLVLAGSAALAAQQTAAPAPKPSAALNLVVPGAGHACSAAWMRATQGSSSQALRADNGQSQPLMTPTLTLTPLKHQALVSAVVTAHGLPPTPGAMNLVAQYIPGHGSGPRREVAKTLTIKLIPGENGSYSATLALPGFSAVTSIALDSVTYADGSTWNLDPKDGCSVVPDPLLLISAGN